MPGTSPLPSRHAEHARHDALIVAQLASEDALDAAQRQEAEQLVASCAECAALAADLRTVARIVAWEPPLPRRRDFRLTAEQADHLRGSRLSRLLRRVPLPHAAALRPTAVGALSIGLLLVVAGNVWPDRTATAPAISPATIRTEVDASAAPQGETSEVPLGASDVSAGALEAPPADVQVDDAAAKADEPSVAEGEEPAVAPAAEPLAEGEAPPAAAAAPRAAQDATEEYRSLEIAAESVTERGEALGAAATAGAADRDRTDGFSVAGDDQPLEPDVEDLVARDELQAFASAGTATSALGSPTPGSTALSSATPATDAAPAPATPVGSLAPLVVKAADGGDNAAAEQAADAGPPIDTVLIVVGTVLAIGGVLLLLVSLLLRRSADPLLR
jgi:hypothetical protein